MKSTHTNEKTGLLANLKMRGKLFLLASGILFLAFIIGALSLYSSININTIAEATDKNSTRLMQHAVAMEDNYDALRTNIYRAMAFESVGNLDEEEKSIAEAETAMTEFDKEAETFISILGEIYSNNDYANSFAEEFSATKAEYLAIHKEAIEHIKAGQYPDGLALIYQNSEIIDKCVANVDEAKNTAQQILYTGLHDVNNKASQNIYIILMTFVFAIFIGGIEARIVSKKITGSIFKLQANVDALQEGDFNAIINSDAKDEIGNITRSLVTVANTVESLVKEVENKDNEYEDGIICPRIETEQFSGGYANLAKAVNHIFETNTEKVSYLVKTINSIASGDLEMERIMFPNEQAAVTDAVFACVDNIKALQTENHKYY